MAILDRAVLDYLYRQVTINYLDANGDPAPFNYSQLTSALDPSGIREVNGANNNLVGHGDLAGSANPAGTPGAYTLWGTADSPFMNLSIGQSVQSSPDAAYNQPGAAVADANPRVISNLISTMYSTSANANPAAAEIVAAGEGSVVDAANGTMLIPDPGVLGGARFNQWFTAFGQFFDHGLDFIVRDSSPSAKITIQLSPLDPLYSLGADSQMVDTGVDRDVTSITVTRAGVANVADAGADNTFGTNDDIGYSVGADGLADTADDVYAKPVYTNNTGLTIDQSQTYGSVASVNALLREYDASGRPTGRVVTHNTTLLTDADPGNDASVKGLQTWADVKENALRIGVQLTDMDVLDSPQLRVDPAGKLLFTPDPNGHYTTASLPTDPGYNAATDPFVRNADGTVAKTGHAFLLDMGFGANPAAPGFDAALLDAHYISGDGRTNENVGLTAVHEVFHEEHNLNVEKLKTSITAEAAVIGGTDGDAYLHQWQIETAPGVWSWDGEKLFQAARVITESEYNHIAVAEYIRSLAPALPEFVSYSTDINLGVSLEFSQAVFRLGHSMLTETFNIENPNTPGQNLKLLDAFLNPTLYSQMDPAALAQGLAKTVANMPDEFVTPALQQSLLGQPLDLAAINIARGRDVGLPTLNELRQQIYDQVIQNTSNASGSAVAPYTSWSDFGAHLGHPESLANFIAAYARGSDTTGLSGDALRAAELGNEIAQLRADYMTGAATLNDIRAAALHVLDAKGNAADPDHGAALRFLGGQPVYNETTGTWDLTTGDQGFWDIDLWIGGLAERPLFDGPLGTTFSFVMLDFAQRMQDGDRFYYLYRQPFAHPLGVQVIAEQFTDVISRTMGIEHFGSAFGYADAVFELGKDTAGTDLGTHDFFQASSNVITFVDGSTGPASDGHIVVAGNDGNDYIIAGNGDDVVYGDAGDDIIQGGQGNDYLLGGDGNDYITDDENDDHIRGGKGDDYIDAGGGILDLVLGEEGNDIVHGGVGIDEVYGGDGDDMVYGDGDTDKVFGENGNDYVDGGDGPDEMFGGAGNDWLRGGVGDDSLQGETGNDLLEGGLGPTANNGDVLIGDQPVGPIGTETFVNQGEGFDVASYEDAGVRIIASLDANGVRQGGLLDTYQLIEGLVGSRFDDELTGAAAGNVGGNGVDNLLVGGAGSDRLEGLAGDDMIFGDSVVVKNDLGVHLDASTAYTQIANWRGTGEVRADFGANGGLGHILGDNGTGGVDTAVFSGIRNDYVVTDNRATDGTLLIRDKRGIDSDADLNGVGGDLVRDIEKFLFNGTLIDIADIMNLAPEIGGPSTASVQENRPVGTVVASLSASDANGDAVTFSIVGGNAAGLFAIDPATGVISLASSPNFEALASPSFTLTVSASDGKLATTQQIAINVLNVDEAATGGVALDYTINGTGNGQTVTLTPQAVDDPDNTSGVYTYQWQQTANNGTTWTNIAGATATTASFTPAASQTVRRATTYTDPFGAHTINSGSAEVGNGSGNTIDGTTGADLLMGLNGSDTYVVNHAGDQVVEAASGGTNDKVETSINGYVLGANVENLTLTGNAAINGTGNSGNNVLTGNNAANTLAGGGGNDTFDGRGGTDTLIGATGNDTYILDNGNDIVMDTSGIDTITSSVTRSLASYSGIENLTLTGNGNINGTGTSGNNVLTGNGGNNTLIGGGGNDTLIGNTGTDTLIGGAGNDSFRGGGGKDTITTGTGADTIYFASTGDAGSGASADVIADFTTTFQNAAAHDRIDLSGIDAISGGGDNAFAWRGTGAFTAAGQLRYTYEFSGGGLKTIVEGNVGGTLAADFRIELDGFKILQQQDFAM